MLAQAAISGTTSIELGLVILVAAFAASGLTAFIVQRQKLVTLEEAVRSMAVDVKLNAQHRIESAAIARTVQRVDTDVHRVTD